MYGKLAVAAGFAAGYVLGSKAGRQRYEEIVAQARKVAGNEKVQSTAGVLQAKGTDLVEKAKQSEIAAKVKSAVGARQDGHPVVRTTTAGTQVGRQRPVRADLVDQPGRTGGRRAPEPSPRERAAPTGPPSAMSGPRPDARPARRGARRPGPTRRPGLSARRRRRRRRRPAASNAPARGRTPAPPARRPGGPSRRPPTRPRSARRSRSR